MNTFSEMQKISSVNKILDYLAAASPKFYFLLRIPAFYCLYFQGGKNQVSQILIDILTYLSHKTLYIPLWNFYPLPPKKELKAQDLKTCCESPSI